MFFTGQTVHVKADMRQNSEVNNLALYFSGVRTLIFSPFSGKCQWNIPVATLIRAIRHYLAASHWGAVGFVILE